MSDYRVVLTPREYEVYKFLQTYQAAQDCLPSPAKTAQHFDISINTAKTYYGRLRDSGIIELNDMLIYRWTRSVHKPIVEKAQK